MFKPLKYVKKKVSIKRRSDYSTKKVYFFNYLLKNKKNYFISPCVT